MTKNIPIKNKLTILKAVKVGKNFSEACKRFGISRDSYSRIKRVYEQGGEDALKTGRIGGEHPKRQISGKVEKAVIECSIQNPNLGRHAVTVLIKAQGLDVSPTGVRNIWNRNNLETFEKRVLGLIEHLNRKRQAPNGRQADTLKKIVKRKSLLKDDHSWRERLTFETLISELSAQFINLPVDQINEEVEKGQRSVCEALGFQSSMISEFTPARDALVAKHCWYAQGKEYSRPYQIVDSQLLTYLMKRFDEDEMFHFHDFLDLGEDSAPVKEVCKKTGIKGGYVFPLRVGDNVIGAISWESHGEPVQWGAALVDRLRLVSEVFANALSRKLTETALRESLAEIRKLKDRLEAENLYLLDEIRVEHSRHEIIGKSPSITKIIRKVEQVAPTDSTVLILGETGTGKELVARAIHNLSSRKNHPMVKVNCSALPAALIESELFGHEKGAFTGALLKKRGRFEVANGATIFLDEIGELPLQLQPKLLRVLQEGQFERLGGTETIDLDVRVIAATNRNLETAVKEGGFRKDLYYRLNIFPVTVPPLRDRLEDISLLVSAFVKEFSTRMGKNIETIPNETIRALQRYGWPGNIRELKNLVERAMIINNGTILRIQLPVSGDDATSLPENMDDLQRKHILSVLERCNWRIGGSRGAAKLLGMNPGTLRFRMKKLNIQRERKCH